MQSKTRVSPSFFPLFFPLLGIALFSITFGGILLSCSRPTEPISRVEFLLGTTCGVTVYGVKDTKVIDAVFQRVREIENRMSVNIETSEVSEINRNAGIKPVRVSEETFHVISEGLRFSALSKGAFDIAIGRLVSLWGIGTDHARLPTPREIQEALAFIDYRSVELNAGNRTVFIKQKGIALDLGAIAKGWAADEAARVLREQGIQHAIIDFGGNILVMGSHPEGRPWRIGIQNPETSRGSYLAIVPGADLSVVTSGTYERFFIGPDGVKYHHLLDTKTGYPIRNGLDSVTVMAKKSIQADGLSTTLFALGWEEGLKLAESLEEVEAIFVTEDRKIYLTSGIRKTFELKNAEFQVMP